MENSPMTAHTVSIVPTVTGNAAANNAQRQKRGTGACLYVFTNSSTRLKQTGGAIISSSIQTSGVEDQSGINPVVEQ